ncbi:MAG: hypothetical protein GY894_01080 [Planctomycetes bacterium]|nr:hypothetical protein [Planctomycetota bacterium]
MGLLGLFLIAVVLWLVIGCAALMRYAKRPPGGAAGRALAAGNPLDPDEAGMNCERWLLRTRDGLDLPVWDISGDGDGAVTVLVHNWGDAPLSMLERARELLPSTQRILIPCLRGHDGAPGACSLGPLEVNDFGRLLETIGCHDVRLEGAGLGGWIIEQVADLPSVAIVTSTDPWIHPSEGYRHILSDKGIPAFPLATVAGWMRW